MIVSDKHKFYLLIIYELIFYPFLIISNYLKWKYGFYDESKVLLKQRKKIETNRVSVCVHEWGGYKAARTKRIRKGKEFVCGLKFQIERFINYDGKHPLDLYITISERNFLTYSLAGLKVLDVSNDGMDFSGYSKFFDLVKSQENHYIIFTNSSVNAIKSDFLDGYIEYMNNNPTVGLLGTSYNSKIYQSLIWNNFNPHIQSFFLLTTIDMVKDIVKTNKGFPGKGIKDKLLLIRNGEFRFSDIVLQMGYELATVLEDGSVYKFNKDFKKDNGHKSWKLNFGDYRLFANNPNFINEIKNKK